jgi:hypothetical protein
MTPAAILPDARANLLALAERCEAAEAPDGELDMLIWAALNGVTNITYPSEAQQFSKSGRVEGIDAEGQHQLLGWIDPGREARNWSPYGGEDAYPKVTASLDAALSLVPEGSDLVTLVLINRDGHKPSAGINGGAQIAHATTPALALTAAALRAHAGGDNG